MKKLYRKGAVHPSPSSTTSDPIFSLSFLPATILALTAALSVDDKQVLAYLLSCSTTTPFDFEPSKTSSSSNKKHTNTKNKNYPCNINKNNTHVACFTCYCFNCYTSYWARWDCSPNRQLIHEIIDAFEDDLLAQRKKKHGVNKRDKKKTVSKKSLDDYGVNDDKCEGLIRVDTESHRVGSVEDGDETEEKQGSVRKMVSFIWGSVWG